MYAYLRETSGVYMSRMKEPLYFASRNFPDRLFGIRINVVRNKHDYLRLYDNVRDEIAIGEASASYLWDNEAPKLIHDTIPKARIIIMLRDPVERAFSHYLMHLRDGSETNLSFYDALKNDYDSEARKELGLSHLYIGYGLYSQQVKRYLDIFGREQVKVIIFEEFVKSVIDTVRDILEFLGIAGIAALPYNIEEAYNVYSAPRFRSIPILLNLVARLRNKTRRKENKTNYQKLHSGAPVGKRTVLRKILSKRSIKPQVPHEARLFLENIYHDDIIRLQRILDRSLPWPTISRYNDEWGNDKKNGKIL